MKANNAMQDEKYNPDTFSDNAHFSVINKSSVASPNEKKILILSVLFVVLVCLLFNVVIFDGIPHGWDSCSYYFQAKVFASGRIVAPGVKLPDWFWMSYIITTPEARYSQYSPGWPLILSLFIFAGIPQLPGPLLSGLSSTLIWLIAAKLFDKKTAWISLILCILSPFFMFMGASYLSHNCGSAFILLSFFFFLKTIDSEDKRKNLFRFAAASVSIIIAMLTRQYSGLLVFISILIILSVLYSIRNRKVLNIFICFSISFFISILLSMIYNKLTTGNPFVSGYKVFSSDCNFLGTHGFHRQSYFQNLAANLPAFFYSLNKETWGWLFPDFWLIAAALPFCLRNKKFMVLFAVIIFFLAGESLYYYFDIHYGPRLVFEILPLIIILTAASLVVLFQNIRSSAARKIMIALIAVNVLYGLIIFYPAQIKYYSKNYCGQSKILPKAIKEKNLDNALVLLNASDGYSYANIYDLNEMDVSEAPVVFTRYNRDRFAEIVKAFPRRETWIINIRYKPIPGKNHYYDRFEITELNWLQVRLKE